ncbi:MAG TPA: Uma2 family endonuclease [Thermomicrobiales bacterium]|nr:Uma2 family endonuclease [Thermomicrobiales bacterium]
MATAQRTKAVVQEQRIVLHNISWKTYECLLADHQDASAPRFTYDRGELEIMSPLREHEQTNRSIASLVEIVAEEQDIEFDNLGSTTFRRQDMERGFEADSCFYIQNESAIRGKRFIDLETDPPPDLVIEVDITRSSLDKQPVFAAIGVNEVWRYDGGSLTILLLDGDDYRPSEHSRALPGVTATDVNRFVAAIGSSGRTSWLRRVRRWARDLNQR